MSHQLHVFPLISSHALTPITDAYQRNAHDHFEQTYTLKLTPKVVYSWLVHRKQIPTIKLT